VYVTERSYSDVGGTPGGLGKFLFGLAMACFGGYLLLHQVTVTGGFWGFYGPNTFGLSMVPLLIGVGMLFFNGRSPFGWLLTIAGSIFILAGIIANLNIYFRPATLFDTLLMLILLFGGLGLIARALKSHGEKAVE
jgi:hypothetical protein